MRALARCRTQTQTKARRHKQRPLRPTMVQCSLLVLAAWHEVKSSSNASHVSNKLRTMLQTRASKHNIIKYTLKCSRAPSRRVVVSSARAHIDYATTKAMILRRMPPPARPPVRHSRARVCGNMCTMSSGSSSGGAAEATTHDTARQRRRRQRKVEDGHKCTYECHTHVRARARAHAQKCSKVCNDDTFLRMLPPLRRTYTS